MMTLSLILGLIILTPIGWIGILCFGAAVAMIVEAKNEARSRLVDNLKYYSQHNPDGLKEFVDGL